MPLPAAMRSISCRAPLRHICICTPPTSEFALPYRSPFCFYRAPRPLLLLARPTLALYTQIQRSLPAHPALLALLCSTALVLGAWPCVGASSLVSDPPPRPLSVWQAEKAGVGFPPQWLPVLLLGVHDTASSPKTTGRVLAHLAMLSTASGWVIPPHGEAHDSPLSSHEATITGGVDSARGRRRLSSCDHGWSVSPPRLCYNLPCMTLLAAAAFLPAALAEKSAPVPVMRDVTTAATAFSDLPPATEVVIRASNR